jgi:2',3'-cyclic-nucleotide 2'-phosphodiesterase (5'-nucleotidase family)
MIDSGDMFGRRTIEERHQTRFLCEVSGEFGLDAIGLGELDLGYGLEFLREMMDTYSLPFTSANVRMADTGELVLPKYLMVEKGGIKFGICSVIDPSQKINSMSAKTEEYLLDDPLTILRDLIPEMRKTGAQTIILLSHLGDKKSETLLHDLAGVDVCLVGHTRRPYRSERVVGQAAFIASSYESRQVGVMECDLDKNGQIQAFNVTITDLDSKQADDPVMLDRIDGFKQELEELRMAARGEYQQTLGSDEETFLIDTECRKCHQDIWEKLQYSGHRSALSTLARKGQHESPECLVCHTTGYLYKGGYDTQPPASALRNVQCEACHGYGSQHERGTGWAAKARTSCTACHDADNSPDFDYDTYWAKIAH